MPPPCTHLQSRAYPCVRVAVHAAAFRSPSARARTVHPTHSQPHPHLTHAHTGVQSVLGNGHSILFDFHWRQPSPSKTRPSKPTPRRARMYHTYAHIHPHAHATPREVRIRRPRTPPHVRSHLHPKASIHPFQPPARRPSRAKPLGYPSVHLIPIPASNSNPTHRTRASPPTGARPIRLSSLSAHPNPNHRCRGASDARARLFRSPWEPLTCAFGLVTNTRTCINTPTHAHVRKAKPSVSERARP